MKLLRIIANVLSNSLTPLLQILTELKEVENAPVVKVHSLVELDTIGRSCVVCVRFRLTGMDI